MLRIFSPFSLHPLLLGLGVIILATAAKAQDSTDQEWSLSATNQQVVSETLPIPESLVGAMTYEVSFALDPSTLDGGNMQAMTALGIGANPEAPTIRDPATGQIELELREGSGRGFYEVWAGNQNLTMTKPDPLPAGWADQKEYQFPHTFLQRDESYPVKLVVTPQGSGSLLRVFVEHFDRPAAEHVLEQPLELENLVFFSTLGGGDIPSNTATLSQLKVRELTPEQALNDRPAWETILRGLDYSRPELAPVAKAIQSNQMEDARNLFLRHMRNRSQPIGPDIEAEEMHPDYKEVVRGALKGEYGTTGWFAGLASHYTDANGEVHRWVNDDGTINWERCNGHLNRHFHWVAMARVYHESGNADVARQFAFEVEDWVTREPFYWDRCPQIGGLNLMDGTIFQLGYMNTSNIGRRCELTWWPAYEVFRKSAEFDEEAHFAMLLGFVRQSRLLMNPTSFAAHDDGGAHGTMALLQNALMFPEFKESQAWKAEAVRRWDRMLEVQFYPDGSHVSGSTGYNWASIHAVENYIRLLRRTGAEVPDSAMEALARGLDHPMGISRPDHGQIDMNDGGWGMVDTYYLKAFEDYFPDRQDFLWMGTSGKKGSPPDYLSKYYPHGGHFVMRTGWGDKEKYAFMDAGPMGASHGKNDKLNIYLAIGPHQLISSGGRGSYDANPYSAYTGSTYAYNTVLVDELPQQRVHLKHTHTGHHPEKRRWMTGEQFDFAEGHYRSGWYGPEKNVQGVHTRQLLFVKGNEPPETGYWILIDTLEPKDEEEHTFQALFHSRRGYAEIEDDTLAFTGFDTAAAFQVLPAHVEGLTLRDAKGQTEPYIQGFHVVGTNHAPMHTAEYSWTAQGPSTRVWVLSAAFDKDHFYVERLESEEMGEDGLQVRVFRSDKGVDTLYWRPREENLAPIPLGKSEMRGDIAILCRDESGDLQSTWDSAEIVE